MSRPDPGTGSRAGAALASESRPPSLIRNVFSNWAGLATSVVYSLVITPVVIRGLEREAYGIWSFLNGLVAYSSLLYVGLGSALIKYVAQHHALGDRASLNRLVSVVFTVYCGLGVSVLVAGVVAAPYVPGLLLRESSVTPGQTVTVTVMVLAARLSMMFVGSVFSGVLVGLGRTDRYRVVTVGGHLSRLTLVPIAVSMPDPLLALAMTVALTGIVEVAALVLIAFKQDPDLRSRIVVPRKTELRMLYGFGILAFLLQAADKLISYTDTTVIGIIRGPEDVALYALPLQIVEYGRIVILGLMSVMLPHLSALVAIGRTAGLQMAYLRVVRSTTAVAVFINTTILWCGQDFLRFWAGREFSEPVLPVIVALGVSSLVQAAAVQSQTPFCLALGRVRLAASVLIVEGLTNLGLSIILAPRYGITGVAVATAVPSILISGTILPIYVSRQVGVPLRLLLHRVVRPGASFLGMMILVHMVAWVVLAGDSFLSLVARGALSTVAAAAGAWLIASDSEQRIVRVRIARKLRLFGLERR